jgi:hypothetical protein
MKRSGLLRGVREFFYGFLLHGMVSGVYEKKAELDDVFMLLILGESIGVPVLPGVYHLRLVPYSVARFPGWKKKIVKPKDLLDILRD